MDYLFYTREIAAIPQDLIQDLLDYSDSSQQDPRAKSYFGDGVNPGFASHSIPSAYMDAESCVQRAVDLLSHVFSPDQYTSCEMNALEPEQTVKAHTDQSSATSHSSINEVFGPLVHQWHTVHIPLVGNGRYLFRRQVVGTDMERPMEHGRAYLYNNYVIHQVLNPGPDIRRNFILHFHDPKWRSKRAIYNQYNIRGPY